MINVPTNLNYGTILLLKKIILAGLVEVPLPHPLSNVDLSFLGDQIPNVY